MKLPCLHEKTTVTGKATIADLLNNDFATNPAELKDHRLIVMFFDLSSMQPEDIDRAVEAAQNYINKKMQPADLVGAGKHGDWAEHGSGFHVG